MRHRDTTTILNTPCILTDRERLAEDIEHWCRGNHAEDPLSVDFTNVHIVAMRTMDPDFHDCTSNVDWFVSDSQVLTWAVSLAGGQGHCRVYGPDFMDYFFRNADPGLTHYLLGASEECLSALRSNLVLIQPEAKIIGHRNGYFEEAEEALIIEDINRCQPDIVWVGLGTPKQQQWINRHKSLLRSKALLAVGFAFDVNAGTKRDAPAWLGPLGLTWLHRLVSEPRRLWKRYLIYNSMFLYRLFKQVLTGKPSPAPRPAYRPSP